MEMTGEQLKAVGGYFELEDVKPMALSHGTTLQIVSGEKAMLSFVTLEPGANVPLHSHPHEQLGTMLEGEIVLYMGGMDEEHGRVIKAGTAYVIPGGVLHGARNFANEKALAIDIFAPLREDYIKMFRAEHGHEIAGLAPVTEE